MSKFPYYASGSISYNAFAQHYFRYSISAEGCDSRRGKSEEHLNPAAQSIGIIGGADGPTAIFIAGKIGKGTIAAGVGIVAIILVAAIVIIRKVWKKK